MVRVGIFDNPPIAILHADAKPTGLAVDVLRDVAEEEDWTIEYVQDKWPNLLGMLAAGRIDLLVGIAYTEERARRFDFTSETLVSNWGIVFRKPSAQIDSALDLEGLRVAVLPKSIHTRVLRDLSAKFGVRYTEVPARDYDEVLQLVDAGKADAGVVNRLFGLNHSDRYGVIETAINFNPVEVRFATPKGTGAALRAALDSYLSQGRETTGSAYHAHLDRWISSSGRTTLPPWLIWSSGGVMLGLFLALVVIWGLRRKLGLQIRQLAESESRFHRVVQSMPIMVDAFDGSGTIIFWNKECERITGYSAEEVVGNPNSLALFYPDPDYRAWVLSTIAKEGGDFRDLEFDMVCKDGSIRCVAWSNISEKLPIPGWRTWAVASDITDRKRAEEQLRQALKMEALGQLTGGVAHDFNNLLMVISGNLDLLETRVDGDDKALVNVTRARAALQKGADLTRRLLAFSRRQALAPTTVCLDNLVLGMEDMLRRSLREDIEITFVLPDGLWPVTIDSGQLETALLNLAVNARDAMPSGGRLTVSAENRRLDEAAFPTGDGPVSGDYVALTIADTGSGIAADIADKVFDPFFTTKEKGKGTGLGLSMVYGFIAQSRGAVRLSSLPGRGTAVTLLIPRAEGGVPAVPPPQADATAPRTGRERILVVEDDAEVRAVANAFLEEAGYQVVEAEDAAQALAVLEAQESFDLLFSDVVLPNGLNGAELAARVTTRSPATRVLLTTGYSEDAIIHRGKLDDGVHLISKPYPWEALLRKVREVLDEERD